MPLQQTSGNSTTDAYGGGVAAKVNYIENYFQTWLRTGTGASTTVTTGLDASTNKALVWTKSRSAATDHKLTDTVRGATQALISDTTGAQTTDSTGLTAFSSTGYTIGADTNYNNSGATYVDWEFVATPKFFDVVTYTGNSRNRVISHNLGSTPGMIIVKDLTSALDWIVYHTSTGATQYLNLNSTAAATTSSAMWNNTSPTSTNFSLGTDFRVNNDTNQFVAYLFASNAGGFGLTGTDNVISCGSYTGNGSSTGPINTLGYEPQWILIKEASTANNWYIWDTMRGLCDGGIRDAYLQPNTALQEVVGNAWVQPLATGFQPVSSAPSVNTGGETYIYIAIRRGPMKVPTDATKVFATLARTGTGATAIVTGANFAPDTVIYKCRQSTEILGWNDRLRGPFLELCTSNTSAETSYSNDLSSFNMNGYTIGSSSFGQGNGNTQIYANWLFGRAPGFFDEVCDTGTGSAHTISHNLQAVPELIIRKGRSDATQWEVYSSALANTEKLVLNSTAAKATDTTAWNSTTPTSSVFTVGTGANVNTSSSTYVTYLFATCPGVSKVGSYTGNGTTQTINCGFAGGARFVLIKRTNSTGDWYVYDTARGMTTLTDPYLLLDSTAAETATLGSVTTVTTGFAVNAAILAAINTNAATYLYLSIA